MCGMEKFRYDIKFLSLRSASLVVVQDDIYNRKTDMIVVGETEQNRLAFHNQTFIDYGCVGDVKRSYDNIVLVKNKVFSKYFDYSHGLEQSSAAIVVEGQKFFVKDIHLYIEKKTLDNIVVNVVEPSLMLRRDKNVSVHSYLARRNEDGNAVLHRYEGKEAIEEAKKDLHICYKNVLEKAYEYFTEKNWERRISLQPLSAVLGLSKNEVARIAVETVFEFIRISPDKGKYGWIEFVVLKAEDCDLYGKLLDEIIQLYKL